MVLEIERIKNKIREKNYGKNFCMFVFGMTFSSISVSVFFNPNNIVTTGSTGLAILLNKFINIDLSLLILVLSSILLVLDFGVFGIEHGTKNILGTILYPIFIKATSLIADIVYFNNTSLFLLILVGGVFSGIGFGLVKKSGYSLGGFYTLYDLFNKRFRISIGKANLICNMTIIIASLFIFGLDKCIYAFIGLYVSSYVGDRIMIGISRNKAFYIVTSKPNLIKDYIVNNLNRTVTVVNAKGGYSDRKKKMLLCVMPTKEYNIVKEIIIEIDNKAFFLITDSYYVSK